MLLVGDLEALLVEGGLDPRPQLARDLPLRERLGLHRQPDRDRVGAEILNTEHLRLSQDLPGVLRVLPQLVGDVV